MLNEANTRAKLIDPILKDSGWTEGLIDREIQIIKKAIIKTLENNERFWNSERGFQGQFNVELQRLNAQLKLFPDEATFEQEYPKKIKDHGLNFYPDLIIHIPFENGLTRSRKEGNFLVCEIKKKANSNDALNDFSKLNEYIRKLNYPVGFFINIDSDGKTFFQSYQGDNKEKIHELSIYKKEEEIKIKHAYYEKEKIQFDDIA